MAQSLRFLHYSDLLSKRISDSMKTGGLTNLRLCTLNLHCSKLNYGSREHSKLAGRIRDCVGSTNSKEGSLSVWIFTGSAVIPKKASFSIPADFSNEIVKQLFDLASSEYSLTGFELAIGKEHWFFIDE